MKRILPLLGIAALAISVMTACPSQAPSASDADDTDPQLSGISDVSYSSSTTCISSDAQFAKTMKALAGGLSLSNPGFSASKSLKRSLDGSYSNDYVTFSGLDAFLSGGCKGTVTARGSKTFSSTTTSATAGYSFSASGTLSHDLALDESYDVDGDGTAESIPTLLYDNITNTQPTSPFLSNNTLALSLSLSGSANVANVSGTATASDNSTATLTVNKAIYSIDGLSLALGLNKASLSSGSGEFAGSGTFTLDAGGTIGVRCVLSSNNSSVPGGKLLVTSSFKKAVSLKVADIASLVNVLSGTSSDSDKQSSVQTFIANNGLASADVSLDITVWNNSNAQVYSKNYTLSSLNTLLSSN